MDIVFDPALQPARLTLAGEANIYAAAELKAALLDALAHGDDLAIDLSGVSEIDSAGLQALIAAQAMCKRSNRTLALVGRSPAVLDLIGLYDLADFFSDPAPPPADSDAEPFPGSQP